MELRLSDQEVIKMAKLAILASRPVGLGFLHHMPKLKEEDIQLEVNDNGLYIDYYQGRMVKFNASKIDKGMWYFNDTINPEYQSWIGSYPTYEALASAAVDVL